MVSLAQLAPYWRTVSVSGNRYPVVGWDGDWSYHFRLGSYREIEVCELLPRPDENAASYEQCVDICRAIGFELELRFSENIIKIVAYRNM